MNHVTPPVLQFIRCSNRSVSKRVLHGSSRRWALCALAVFLSGPAFVRADTKDDGFDKADARVAGYEVRDTYMKSEGIGMTTMLFLGLTALGCGVLFKNANRSHMD